MASGSHEVDGRGDGKFVWGAGILGTSNLEERWRGITSAAFGIRQCAVRESGESVSGLNFAKTCLHAAQEHRPP